MGFYSKDEKLSGFVEKAYGKLLSANFEVDSETFKESQYGVSFKVRRKNEKSGKTVNIAIYHTEKKGFSVVTADAELHSILLSLLSETGTLGSDEAGKGDVFGPLVVCSFLLGEREQELLKLGVKDSKRMKNEEILDVYKKIQTDFPDSFSLVRIMPERYNSFYKSLSEQGKNLNNLLAWAHSKAVSNVVSRRNDITQVLIDKFTDNPAANSLIISAANGIPIKFQVRAEQNPAVALASIVARAGYLISLNQISETVLENTFRLIPGSGAESDRLLEGIIGKYGAGILSKIAKTHFANCEKLSDYQDLI